MIKYFKLNKNKHPFLLALDISPPPNKSWPPALSTENEKKKINAKTNLLQIMSTIIFTKITNNKN